MGSFLKKRSKKGLSHVDWAISLAIFLLYLAWFFVFVKPHLAPPENIDVLLDIAAEGFQDHFFTDMYSITIKVDGQGSEKEPIIIPFTKNWSQADMSHTADYFVIDDGKMLFIGNTSKTSRFNVYYPHEAIKYSQEPLLSSDQDKVQYGGFKILFDSYLAEEMYHGSQKRLWDFRIESDGTEIDDEGQYENLDLAAKYVRESDIEHKTYVFADNPRTYNFVRSADNREHKVMMEFTTYNYSDYYFGQSRKGKMRYTILPTCRFYDTNFLDLYSSDSGMALIFNRNITLKMCTNETNALIEVYYDLDQGEELEYDIFFHEGDYHSIEQYPLKRYVGTTEKLTMLSEDKVNYYKNWDYGTMKEIFNYPDMREFNITIRSDAVDADYGIAQPKVQDIYARKLTTYILDKDFKEHQANISITVW